MKKITSQEIKEFVSKPLEVIVLVPMKKYSERITNKNMRDFCGKPLYHRVMESLLKSKYTKFVVIDTDSQIIVADALKNFNRVKIINRIEELRGDFVPMNDIITYDLSRLKGEHFLQTHSTNPLLIVETLERAIETYFKNLDEYDSLFSVTRLQTRLYWENGTPINHNLKKLVRSQDLLPVFEENSNLYIFSKKSFRKAKNKRIGLKPKMFEINKLEAVDIDESEDWEIAEILYKLSL